MQIDHLEIFGSSVLGLFACVTDKYCWISDTAGRKATDPITENLGVRLVRKSIINTNFIGLFATGNSQGVIVPELAEGLTLDIPVHVIQSKSTCLGNLILCNDHGAIVSPLLKKNLPQIAEALGVKAEIGTIAGLNIVGSCGLATNKGCLVHPEIEKEEAQLIEKILGVHVEPGTLNRGSPYVGACALANSNGALVGYLTMPPELLRLEETLG